MKILFHRRGNMERLNLLFMVESFITLFSVCAFGENATTLEKCGLLQQLT